ncbi:hypothetical protein CGZ93_08465 [Enemella dayhoffiae]|uniref:Uncharacterized protein n=1 Tax=Enemella dayhoffiae TaxID=2016507 RepID=A0A255H2Z7_9ACTN|nr:hypothetical protein CGZ93_08465 [Enemella dayhoffiae]
MFVTRDSSTGKWSTLPVQRDGDFASVEMGHFSRGMFAWVDDAMQQFVEQVQKFLRLRYAPPSCHTKTATLNGVVVSAHSSANTLYACVEAVDGNRLRLSVYSNSPFTWDVFPKLGAAGEQPRPAIDGVAIAGTALFGLGSNHNYTQQTLQFPGSSTSVIGSPGSTSFGAVAAANPTYTIAYVALAAVEAFLVLAKVNIAALEWKNVAECASDVVTTANAGDPGPIVATIVRCAGDRIGGFGGAALAALASLPSLLGAAILGAIAGGTGNDKVALSVDPVQRPTPTPTPIRTPPPSPSPCSAPFDVVKGGIGNPQVVHRSTRCSKTDPSWARVELSSSAQATGRVSSDGIAYLHRVNGTWTYVGGGFHGGSFCLVLKDPALPSDFRSELAEVCPS